MIREFDVIVAGGGLTGAAFATLLSSREEAQALRIAVIESHPFTGYFDGNEFDPRVVALTETSRQLLSDIGVWEQISARRVSPYTRMSVRDHDGTGFIEFDSADVRASNLGHIVENSNIVGALLEKMAHRPNVELICPARVSGVHREGEQTFVNIDGVSIDGVNTDGGGQLQAPLLVAADGAVSHVRELCDFHLREKTYGHKAIVATIGCEKENGATARQWFSLDGPLAFLPLQNGEDRHKVSIVWSQRDERADELMALPDDQFCLALGRASEHSLGNITDISQRYSFPLLERHATDYVKPGVALLGDAAHTIHPLAGQGANLGFKDVVALVDELCRACIRGLPLGDESVLGRYQRNRKPDNLATMLAMQGFKQLFGSDNLNVRLLRNKGMSLVNRAGPVKKRLIRQAMGI